MKTEARKILEFLHTAENLKKLKRHSWLSDGRHESVAEHTWRMSLMFLLVDPYLRIHVDRLKTLEMIIVHDMVEALVGDVPAFHSFDEKVKKLKYENENSAIKTLRGMLNNEVGEKIFDLWHEFEKKETNEAKVANALDKLEAQIQHNEADIATWLDIEKEMLYMMDKHVEFNAFLSELKNLVVEEGEKKMRVNR